MQAGNILQGLIVTRKRLVGTIGFVHVVYCLDFQLSQEVIHHMKKKKMSCPHQAQDQEMNRDCRPIARSLSHNDEALLEQCV